MEITVRPLKMDAFTVGITDTMLVEELKELICEQEGIAVRSQTLVLQRKVVEDGQSLSSCGVTDGATITLLIDETPFGNRQNDKYFCRLPEVLKITSSATQLTFGLPETPPVIDFACEDHCKKYHVSAWLHFPLDKTGDWRTLFRSNKAVGGQHAILFKDGSDELGTYNNCWYGSGWVPPVDMTGWHHVAAVSHGEPDNLLSTVFSIDKKIVGVADTAVPSNITFLGSAEGGCQFVGTIAGVLIVAGGVLESEWKAYADATRPHD